MELFVAADQSTKSKRAIKNKNKRKKLVEGSSTSFTATKDEMRKERKMKKKPKLQAEDTETGMAKMCADQSIPKATKNNDRKRMKTERKNEGDEKVEKKQMNNSLITDDRFAWAQLDPRFQRMPKREAKVPVDSRFSRLLSDRNFSSSSAPVDKRGKVRKSKEFNPLLNYYFHEKPEVAKGEDADEVEREKTEEENANTASTSSDGRTDESSSTTDDEDNDDNLDDLNEYLASSDDSDDEHRDAEKLRSLLDPNNNSNKDQSDNDKNMEIIFNTGLENLSKRILEKRDKKTETVGEQVLRKRREKKKARKNWSKNSSDDEDSDCDVKVAHKQPDDFFVEETTVADFDSANKITKISKDRMKPKKDREQPQEIEKEQEASRAELELLFAKDQEIEKGPRGYNIKSKKTMGKKVKDMADEKLPEYRLYNDPRFSALCNNHLYALYPTDPHYKRGPGVQLLHGNEFRDRLVPK